MEEEQAPRLLQEAEEASFRGKQFRGQLGATHDADEVLADDSGCTDVFGHSTVMVRAFRPEVKKLGG